MGNQKTIVTGVIEDEGTNQPAPQPETDKPKDSARSAVEEQLEFPFYR